MGKKINQWEFVKSYDHFNRWKRIPYGYFECFEKKIDPNISTKVVQDYSYIRKGRTTHYRRD